MNLKHLIVVVCCLVTSALPALAGPRELTLYRDGTLVELEIQTRRGVAEVLLPGPIREGTLRVGPLDAGTVGKVELLPPRVPDKLQKELEQLREQKFRLEDRMKALETKETIFAAAAKSQSSKAPRKSKTNPDPMASVRQGTEFAIAQLEAVFTARRRTEQELKRVSDRLAQLEKKGAGGPTVRVAVTPASARIRVAAVLQETFWTPRYELRLDSGKTARLTLLAELGQLPEGYALSAVPHPLAAQQQQSIRLQGAASPKLAEWSLPVEQEQVVSGPLPAFTVVLQQPASSAALPSGPVAVYSRGEYLGTAPLTVSANSTTLTVTNRP